MTARHASSVPLRTAMACAGLVTAQFVAGKAARDAIFLANLPVTSLPTMILVASAVSLVLVALGSRIMRRMPPSVFVPAAFLVSTVLFLVEWAVAATSPRAGAPLVYLHVSAIGPMLGSGFWLVTSERFDPHTAKRRFGQIAGMGTLGGLVGGLVAERLAGVAGVTAMLPVLALFNLACAWQIRVLAAYTPDSNQVEEPAVDTVRSGWHVLGSTPYLRTLAALVMLSTVAAALVDYVFKAQVVSALGGGDALLRFFAVYYAASSLLTFLVQTACSQRALSNLGLGAVVGIPSAALIAGSVWGLVAPGLWMAVSVRGGESILRASLFRSAYELFFTAVPVQDKRTAKSLIDVGFDRLGDAVGAALIRGVLVVAPARQLPALLALTIAGSALALYFASRLNRGYLQTLERSLLGRAVELDLSDVRDLTTRTVLLRTIQRPLTHAVSGSNADDPMLATPGPDDPVLVDIAALRSRDRQRVLGVLRREDPLRPELVSHVIPLLARNSVANEAVQALRAVADTHAGALIDSLTDPNQPFAVRRRLPRALAVCTSARAADGLVLGLADLRFEVRFQCARALAAIHERQPRIRIDTDRVLAIVEREVTVSRPVWESHRLLDRLEDTESNRLADTFLAQRASQSLTHVFTLLSLVLPAEPLLVAFRGLTSLDDRLRGTALEYLEGVLPPEIRRGLWPFLDGSAPPRAARAPEAVAADLARLNPSVVIDLSQLQAHARPARTRSPSPTGSGPGNTPEDPNT